MYTTETENEYKQKKCPNEIEENKISRSLQKKKDKKSESQNRKYSV